LTYIIVMQHTFVYTLNTFMEGLMDFTKPIEIAHNIHWVGMYLENDPFQCHPYLIENGDASVLVDPGSMLEFDAVVANINRVSSMKNIKYIILHHQDPDLAAAVPEIEKLIDRDDLHIITHSRMVPLVKHYMITSPYYEIDKHHFILEEGDLKLHFITTPYCHSPGAFVSYEPQTKTLFSGDIFGGIEESWEFYAKEDYFEKAKQFHAEYMPSRAIFNYSLEKIETLDLELIAPQHGSMIQRPYIMPLIKKMKKLECGLYIKSHFISLKEGYVWDKTKKCLRSPIEEIPLKEKEKIALNLLCTQSPQTVSVFDIYNYLYEDQPEKEFSSDAVTSLIKRLRQKLPKKTISSIYGVGYVLHTA